MILFNLIRQFCLPLTLLTLTAITVLSLYPVELLPPVPGSDKTHHFIAYGLLIFPVALRQPKTIIIIALGFITWSGAIELIQPYVNRYGEWLDLLANIAGLTIGLLVATIINCLFPASSYH